MSLSINFTNIYGEVITPQQVNNLDYYEKNHHKDGQLKKKELFENGILSDTLYYVSNDENLSDLISSYQNQKITFYTNKLVFGQYNKFDSLRYDRNNLIDKSILIIDGLEKIICEKKLDVIDNVVKEYEKYYYNNDGDLVYLFQYYSNGGLKSIIYFDELNGTEEYYHDSQKTLEFNWSNLAYYQNAEPIIPS